MICVGLMSGTSLDGIDAVAVRMAPWQVLGHVEWPLPPTLRAELLALNQPGPDELHRAALAANALARAYAEAVRQLLAQCDLRADQVAALGAHGQTVRHQPGLHDGCGYTVQLLNAALLAELSGIAVVADLRSRDVAAGGQGAPLVPAFHRARFHQPGLDQAVLNLGGIANLTLLHADGTVGGFDCGPANALLDHWIQQHGGMPFDAEGAWAAGGQVQPALLQSLMDEPFFRLPPPKSTGRDLFNPAWLQARLARGAWAAQDVQATLAELTVRAAAEALQGAQPAARRLLVCGGGARNGHLMRRLQTWLPQLVVRRTDDEGLPAQQVEAAAFAWLAHAHLQSQPGNLPQVTGARGPRVLGALHPAR